MSRTRLVLIGLAAAVVVALVAAWAVPVVGNLMSANRANGVIRIAIATDETIERMITDSGAAEADPDGSNKVTRFLGQTVNPSAPPPQTSGDPSANADGNQGAEGSLHFRAMSPPPSRKFCFCNSTDSSPRASTIQTVSRLWIPTQSRLRCVK
ncbi:MAG: hypothetical protein M0D54_20355 [Hyphomonadaceae bacterium JAD_PAG50586_4]|nr:MAG: hypothetical protein M0D54_20355 [Hyphomonadaceae bacterium JAD_PAG50586_4]